MRWLVTGASGTLGSYLVRGLTTTERSIAGWTGSGTIGSLFGTNLEAVDLGMRDPVVRAFRAARPDIVLHAGAMARVDACAQDPGRARRVNTEGTQLLAELAATTGARLVYVSTDLVFDGEQAPYREADLPAPLSVYGRSKADAERAVCALPNGAVARVSLLFGPSLLARRGFFDALIAAVITGQPFTLFADEWRTPLGLSAAARALITLARSDFTGVIHLGGPERLSRLDMGRRLARFLNASDKLLVAGERNSTPGAEPRPRDVSLDSTLWGASFPKPTLPGFETALADMLNK